MPNKNDLNHQANHDDVEYMTAEQEFEYKIHKYRFILAGIFYPVFITFFCFLYVVPIEDHVFKSANFNSVLYAKFMLWLNESTAYNFWEFVFHLGVWGIPFFTIIGTLLLAQNNWFRYKTEKIANLYIYIGIIFSLIAFVGHFLK
jgi:hypothetical protein